MKRFRFENIWLLSPREKRARHVRFHPRKNLILGRNHTGKTSLIRALFECLWATPYGKLERWEADTVSLLQFSVGTDSYFALRQAGRHALFDAHKNLLVSTTEFGVWSEAFRKCTGFNLVFANKAESEVVPADPACFFLPFYVNQDGSWQSEWNTFTGLKRFNKPYSAILEYFTGVCPPSFYVARAEKVRASTVLEEARYELKLLRRTMDRFNRSIPMVGPKVTAENFDAEIARLTEEVNAINQSQEKLRSKAVRERELLASLDQQIRLAEAALKTYQGDVSFLKRDGAEPLICPTCHAEHDRPFMDLLEFAEDARVVRELEARLRDDAAEVRRRCQLTTTELESLNDRYSEVSRLLDTRKGEMLFQDVVEAMGAESAFAAFESERRQLQEAVDKAVLSVNELDERMKALRSKERATAILAAFRVNYAEGRAALNLPYVDVKKVTLASRPNLSGSGGPRSVLAYYAAIWRTQSEYGAYDVPVVIDSPNQQAQDDLNLPAVLSFIARGLPGEMQLIVGLEGPTEFKFDMELVLETPWEMLDAEQWPGVRRVIEPLCDKADGS